MRVEDARARIDPSTHVEPRRPPGGSPARRHCMIVYAYYPFAETRVQREAEALVDAGYAVDVVCLRRGEEHTRERYRGVDIYRVRAGLDKSSLPRQFLSYLRFLALATARVTRLHLRHAYRTVQVHNLPDFLVFSAIVPKLRGVPVILDLHDLMPEFFAGRFSTDGHRRLARLVRWQERAACRFADHVITVSEHWRQALIRRGVPERKCSVVMNVADERVFSSRSTRAPDDEFRLLYHGTLTHRYGLDLLIRAVDRVRQDIPGIRLTIHGMGEYRSTLVELRAELGLEMHVDLPDRYIPEEELPGLIASADVGVVPYRDDVFTDGIVPTKLMEYAAVGIPCIAARTSAIDAYFRDTMVEFFRPGDVDDLARRIRELYADPMRRAQLARASVNFTERHSWTQVRGGYVTLVDRLGERG